MKRKRVAYLLVLGLLLACVLGLSSCKECKHEELAYAETVAPTCVATGTESAFCPVCEETLTRQIPALGHSFAEGYCGGCQTGLYTNLLSSLQKDGLTLSVEGLQFTVTEEAWGETLTTVYKQLSPTYFTFDGSEGTALCHMLVTDVLGDGISAGSMSSREMDILLTLSAEDGVFTTVTVKQAVGNGLFAEATVFSWAAVLPAEEGAELGAVLEELSPLLDMDAAERNAACRAFLSFLTYKETEKGYVFAPDAKAAGAYLDRILHAENAFALVEVLYGEGAVETWRSELRELCTLTVREAWDKLRAHDVDVERLWDAIEQLTDSEIDFLSDPSVLSLRLYQVMEAMAQDAPLPTDPITAEAAGAAFDEKWEENVLPDGELPLYEFFEMTEQEWEELGEAAHAALADVFSASLVRYTTDALGNLSDAEFTVDLSALSSLGEMPSVTTNMAVDAGVLRVTYETTEPTREHAFELDKVLSRVEKTKATLPVAQDDWVLEGGAAMVYDGRLRVSAELWFDGEVLLTNKKTGKTELWYAEYAVPYTAECALTAAELAGVTLSPTERTGVYDLSLAMRADKAVLGVPHLIAVYNAETYEEGNAADYTFAETPEISLEETEITVLALYNTVMGNVIAPTFEDDSQEPEDPEDPDVPSEPDTELYMLCFYEEDGETLIDCIFAEYGEDVTDYVYNYITPKAKWGYEFSDWQSTPYVSLSYVTKDADLYPVYLPIEEEGPLFPLCDGRIPLVDGIVVDGLKDDAYLTGALLPLDTSRQADGRTTNRINTDVDGVASLVWDGEYIYILVEVADSTLGGRSQAYLRQVFNAYLNDTVEVYYSLYQGERQASSMKIGVDSMGIGKYCTKNLSEVTVGDTNYSTHFEDILFATSSAISPLGEYGSLNEELTEDPYHAVGAVGAYSYCVEIAIPARTEGVADVDNAEGLTVDPLTGFVAGRENADGSRTDDPDDYRFTDGEALLPGDLARFSLQIIDLPFTRAQLADTDSACHEDASLDGIVGNKTYLYDAAGREITPRFCAYGHTQSDLTRYLTFVLGDVGEEGYSRIYDFDAFGTPLDENGADTVLYATE